MKSKNKAMVSIVGIIAALSLIVFSFNNCGQGFEQTESSSITDPTNPGPKTKAAETFNVVYLYPNGSYVESVKDYVAIDGDVYLDGVQIGSSELIRKDSTYFFYLPANELGLRTQNVTRELYIHENSGTKTFNAVKGRFRTHHEAAVERIIQNKVLYYAHNSHYTAQFSTFAAKFNQEMDDNSIDFRLTKSNRGRYPKLAVNDAFRKDSVNYKTARRVGKALFTNPNGFGTGKTAIVYISDRPNGRTAPNNHKFYQVVMESLGFVNETSIPRASSLFKVNEESLVVPEGLSNRVDKYDLRVALKSGPIPDYDDASVLVDSSFYYHVSGIDQGANSSIPAAITRSDDSILPVKTELSAGDLRALKAMFGVKQTAIQSLYFAVATRPSEFLGPQHDFLKVSFFGCFNPRMIPSGDKLRLRRTRFYVANGVPALHSFTAFNTDDVSAADLNTDRYKSTEYVNRIAACRSAGYTRFVSWESPRSFVSEAPAIAAGLTLNDRVIYEVANDGFAEGLVENPFLSALKRVADEDSADFQSVPTRAWHRRGLFGPGSLSTKLIGSTFQDNNGVKHVLVFGANDELICSLTSGELNTLLQPANILSNQVDAELGNRWVTYGVGSPHGLNENWFRFREHIGSCMGNSNLRLASQNLLADALGFTPQGGTVTPITGTQTGGEVIQTASGPRPVCNPDEVNLANLPPGTETASDSQNSFCIVQCSALYINAGGVVNCDPSSPPTGSMPICVGADSDPDGDGFGWENDQSCRVQGGSSGGSGGLPTCSSSSLDPDGDGFGWENNQTCVVDTSGNGNTGGNTGGNPVCTSADSDPDGDGWGFENGKSCVVSSSGGSGSGGSGGVACVDTDGDGFGFDGSGTCYCNSLSSILPNYTPPEATVSCN